MISSRYETVMIEECQRPICYCFITYQGFVSFGDTWVMEDCSQVSRRNLLGEVKDLVSRSNRSFAALWMTSFIDMVFFVCYSVFRKSIPWFTLGLL